MVAKSENLINFTVSFQDIHTNSGIDYKVYSDSNTNTVVLGPSDGWTLELDEHGDYGYVFREPPPRVPGWFDPDFPVTVKPFQPFGPREK